MNADNYYEFSAATGGTYAKSIGIGRNDISKRCPECEYLPPSNAILQGEFVPGPEPSFFFSIIATLVIEQVAREIESGLQGLELRDVQWNSKREYTIRQRKNAPDSTYFELFVEDVFELPFECPPAFFELCSVCGRPEGNYLQKLREANLAPAKASLRPDTLLFALPRRRIGATEAFRTLAKERGYTNYDLEPLFRVN